MPAISVDPAKVHEFKDAQAFNRWLARHHDRETEVWIKLHKVGSGLPSITPKEAIDVVLCWGWIDGVRKAHDEHSYLQRYTPRGKRSIWSKINVANVARLIEAGRMTPHGLREVQAAQADGRWDRAYASGQALALPADFLAAVKKNGKAKAMLARLNAQNRYSIAFRLHAMKTEAGRQRKIAAFVQMLERGETVHPQKER